jgi:hypothetical protein
MREGMNVEVDDNTTGWRTLEGGGVGDDELEGDRDNKISAEIGRSIFLESFA